MTDLERIKMKINGSPFDLVLPGNGRFDVLSGSHGIPESEWVLYFQDAYDEDTAHCIADSNGGTFTGFPDACDNAAEWHRERCDEIFHARIPSMGKWHEHYDQYNLWRAAKRAHQEATNET